MPNTGRPSRDCRLCRERRVKCDLTRPSCRRCTRIGRECPGYRDELDIRFHREDMAPYPQNAARDRRFRQQATSRSASRDTNLSQISTTNTSSSTLASTTREASSASNLFPLASERISQSWDDHVLSLIFGQLSPSSSPQRILGVLDYFPDLLTSPDIDPALVLSSKALVFNFLNNKYNNAELKKRKMQTYVEALGAINKALLDPVLCRQDTTLFSVFLLGVYELMRGASATAKSPSPADWEKHVRGMLSLFRLRGQEQFTTQRGCDIFQLLNENNLVLALVAKNSCDPNSLEWLEASHEHLSSDFQPGHQRAVQACKAADAVARMRYAENTADVNNTRSLLDEAQDLDKAMTGVMNLFTFEESIKKGLGHNLCAGNTVRMKLHRSTIDLIDARLASNLPLIDNNDLQQRRSTAVSELRSVADDILSTVPYLLGPDTEKSEPGLSSFPHVPRIWVESVRLLFPLRTIASNPFLRQDQIMSGRSGLNRISDDFQVRFAVQPFWTPTSHLHMPVNQSIEVC